MGALTSTTYYLLQITDATCGGTVSTASIKITVDPASAAGTVGNAQTICYNATPVALTTTAAPSGSGNYTYQWQSSPNNSTWTNITGATTNGLPAATMGALTSTAYYRLQITDVTCGGTVSTPSVTISVDAPLANGTIGASQTICHNATPAGLTNVTSPTGGTGTYTYQWQSAAALAGPFANIGAATNPTYSPGALAATTYYRRQETSGACGTVSSNTITIAVDPVSTAGVIGAAQTICNGATPTTLTITTAPTGGSGNYTYQWQSAAVLAGPYLSISGATNTSYSPSALTSTTYYELQVIDASCGPINTAAVTIAVDAVYTAGTIGTSQTICYNTTPANLTNVTAPTGGSGSYTFQWQSAPDNATWTNISGATANNLTGATIGNLTASTYYRRQVTDANCGILYSASILITVDPLFVNGAIGISQTICHNATPGGLTNVTSPTGGTGTYTYQWQSAAALAGPFANIGGATNPTYSPGALAATTYYRRQETSGACGTVNSNTLTITVYGAFAAGTIGTGQIICSGSTPATLTTITSASGGAGSYTYQWQSASALAGPYTIISGATNTSYSPGVLTSTTYYELQVTDASCGTINTAAVTITVDGVITNNTVETNGTNATNTSQSICINQTPLQITGTNPAGGSGAYTYQWQSAPDNVTWTPISGANAVSYTPPALSTAGTYYYQRVVTSGPCTSASNSEAVTVLSSAPATPTTSTFGNGVWNCYAYTDATFGTSGGAYAGYFTSAGLSFSTATLGITNLSPSDAPGYQGCQVAITNFSVSLKQTNFTPGIYEFDLSFNDDQFTLLINGIQVYTRGYSTATITNIWTGSLGATDQIEVRWVQNAGGSGAIFSLYSETNPGPVNPGTIAGNQSVCNGQAPQQAFSNVTSASSNCQGTANGCYITGYQWQLSTDSINWNNIVGATALAYTETNTLTKSQWYRRAVNDACGNVAYSTSVKVTVNIVSPGNPTVYGNGQWNAYAYTDNNFGNSGGAYAGYFTTSSALSFSTATLGTSGGTINNLSPSYASGYQGCEVALTQFSVSLKRTNIPAGIYQVDVPNIDDVFYLLVNGVIVYTSPGCCVAYTNVWTGPIASTDQVEIRWVQLGGGSNVAANFTLVTPAALGSPVVGANQAICPGNIPPNPLTITTPATGGCTIQYYQWQSSPDASTWTNVSGANANAYTITNTLLSQTYYRLQITDYCGNIAFSNNVTISVNSGIPSTPTTSTFGNNQWNVYCYADVNASIYMGYYVEPLLSFKTTNRYVSTAPPTAASGFQGCQITNVYYATEMKRQNFTPGTYQIDLSLVDDYVSVYIDGNLVATNVCCTPVTNIWTGNLGATDSIRVYWYNNAGPGDCGLTFTAITPPTSVNPGTIVAQNPTLCTNDAAIINNVTLASGGCFVNYSWQSSTDGGTTWTTVSGATSSTYTATTNTTTTTQYQRVATDVCGNVAYSNVVTFTTGGGPVGNPATFGNGVWNAYVYSSTNAVVFSNATYYGYYTDANLTFQSANEWASSAAPSTAAGYQGCQINQNYYFVSWERTNFTPNTYQINIPYWDDYIYLYINGNLIYQNTTCCPGSPLVNAWTGNLGATDQVQFILKNQGGPGQLQVSFTVVSPATSVSPGTIGSSQTICYNGTPTAFTNITAGTSSCYVNYQWQSSPNNSTWTNISGATAATYTPGALTATTYYRREAIDACGNTAFTTSITVTVNPNVVAGAIGSTQTICSGGTPLGLTNTTSASGGDGINYAYQWQSAPDNVTWANIIAATNPTYNPGALTSITYFRRNVTSCANTASSASITININPLPVITTQPTNTSTCTAGSATITVAATGTGLTYQWQESTNGGTTWNNITNGVGGLGQVYSNAITASLTITGTPIAMNTYKYQVIITGSNICNITSNAITLSVNTGPVITTQPTNICNGTSPGISGALTVAASGVGLTYQWYKTATAIVGATSSTYNVSSGTQGITYYCIVTGSCGSPATSNTVTIYNGITNTITTANETVCPSQNNTIAATLAGGNGAATYTWQSSTTSPGTSGYSANGGVAANYVISLNTLTQTTWYERVVTMAGCPNVTSTSGTVQVTPSAATAITTQPANQPLVCPGGTATFSVVATGTGLIYQWEESSNGGTTWNNLTDGTGTFGQVYSGSATSTVTVTGATLTMNAYRYRVAISSSYCGIVNSNSVTLTTNNATTVTVQPLNITLCNAGNQNINPNITATGLSLTYQWQLNTGSGWNNILDNSTYVNATSSSLTIYNANSSFSGYQYQCVVTGTCGTVTSNTSTITYSPLTNNAISAVQNICAGVPNPFTGSSPTGGGGGYTYQWSSSPDNANWTAISGATSQNYTPGSLSSTTYYKRVVTSTSCPAVSSTPNPFAITINPGVSITSNPSPTTVCPAQNATFTVAATGTNLTYQWQVNTGSGFSNITTGIQYSGYTTATLTVLSTTSAENNYNYQCVVSSNCSPNSATSSPAALTVSPTPIINTQPSNVASCQGNTATFGVTATGTAITYQWQEKVYGGSFLNITNGGIYSGATSATLTLTGVTTTMNANQYQCILTMGSCSATTTSAGLTVNGQPSLTITNPASVCSPTTINLTAAAVTAGSNLEGGGLSYWTNAGATSSLSNPSTVALGGTYYIKASTTPACYAIAPVIATIVITPSAPSVTNGSRNCTGTVNLSASGSPNTYNWYTASSGGGSLATTATYTTPTLSTTTTYYVSAVNTSSPGCEGPRSAITATVIPCFKTWTGTTNTDWATAGNWTPAVVPTVNDTLTIPSVTKQPIISSTTTANCSNITISNSSSLTLNSGSALNVYGNFVNNGTVTDNGGTTSFVGSSAQTFSGTSGTNLSSLTLNNSNGLTLSSTLTVGGNNSTLGGVLTLTSGTITSNGNLTVNLFLGGISGSGTGAINGNLTVTKFIDTAGYHYISAPMPNCTVTDIDNSLGYSTEYFGSLFWYNEANTSSNDLIGWTNANNTTNYSAYPTLTSMQGFALYLFGSSTLSYTKAYTTNNYSSTINLTSTNSGTSSSDGWNLVGNPYPSSVDWNAASPAWTKTNVDNSVYYYNPATGNYASYVSGAGTNGGTNIIPSMQAFWVHVSTDPGSGSLTVTNTARSTIGSALLWRVGVMQNYLSITASASDNSSQDESIVRILSEATDGFDPDFDAYKLMSDAGSVSLFSKAANDSLSVNSLSDTTANFSVPLFVGTPAGSYNFTFKGALSFENYDVVLLDNLSNTYQDLKQNPTYSFTLTGTDTVSRFFLNMRKYGTTTTNGVTSLMSPSSDSSYVRITNDGQYAYIDFINSRALRADIYMYDVLGRTALKQLNVNVASGKYVINGANFAPGVYVVKVVTGGVATTQKVVFDE